MNRIKILHIVEDLGVGGLEKVIAAIVKNLDREKYETMVWCLNRGGEVAEEIKAAGIAVEIFSMKSYYNPYNIFRLSMMLGKKRIVIVHTHGYFASTFGRISAILARVPIIITHVHSTYFGYTKRNILIEKFLSYFSDAIICVSHAVKEFVVHYERINEKRVHVIYNGIEGPVKGEDGRERSALRLPDDAIVVVTVASLSPHKGHKVLLDAVHILSSKHKKLKLLIVGDGILRKELQLYAERLSLVDQVVFTGKRADVYSLLLLSDIFALPSVEREGLGIAVIEAMACGLPVIGSRLGGIPEVIRDNVNGFLFAPGNSRELAHALDVFVSDGELRNAAGSMGKKIFAEMFTTEEMTRRIASLYDTFLKERML